MLLHLTVGLALAQVPQAPAIDAEALRTAGAVIGLDFTDAELELMVAGARENLRSFERLRARAIPNAVPPWASDPAPAFPGGPRPFAMFTLEPPIDRPDSLDELAFADLRTLAALVKHRRVSCVELTELFLGRLRAADAKLECVISYLDERALARARELDEMLAEGRWLGPLHGIPYGAKDLFAARGAPTTWGAKPFEHQVIDRDAAVIENLEAKGAVLCAKLSLGALAWGDVWFGGRTRNPWKSEQGSSGSSAGSAAAVAAGALPFAIGSETLGSIVSPSARCGCSSLRPTYGAVDTRDAMALSWSMDKLGPLCRSAEDAAIVFDAMLGEHAWRFKWSDRIDATALRVGFLEDEFEESETDRPVLDELRALGVELTPVELPEFPVESMLIILNCEAAAAFDELTRSGRDEELVRQVERAWPNVLRVSRLVPAVEYIQAQRLRTQLIQELTAALADVDVLVHPTFGGTTLTATNLAGLPAFVAPSGFREDGTPRSVSFGAKPGDEAELLALVRAWQAATDYHRRHPR